jgi:hypothetical protein
MKVAAGRSRINDAAWPAQKRQECPTCRVAVRLQQRARGWLEPGIQAPPRRDGRTLFLTGLARETGDGAFYPASVGSLLAFGAGRNSSVHRTNGPVEHIFYNVFVAFRFGVSERTGRLGCFRWAHGYEIEMRGPLLECLVASTRSRLCSTRCADRKMRRIQLADRLLSEAKPLFGCDSNGGF